MIWERKLYQKIYLTMISFVKYQDRYKRGYFGILYDGEIHFPVFERKGWVHYQPRILPIVKNEEENIENIKGLKFYKKLLGYYFKWYPVIANSTKFLGTTPDEILQVLDLLKNEYDFFYFSKGLLSEDLYRFSQK